jgi:hypothetical protein
MNQGFLSDMSSGDAWTFLIFSQDLAYDDLDSDIKIWRATVDCSLFGLCRATAYGQVIFTVFSGAVLWLPRTSVRPLNRTHRISLSFLNQIASYSVQ